MVIHALRVTDFIDIGAVSFIIYRLLLLFRRTRTMEMVLGVLVLALAYGLSDMFSLPALRTTLSYFFNHLVLIIVVLFQEDLKKALSGVARNPFQHTKQIMPELSQRAVELTQVCQKFAKNRTGALIVLERETGLTDIVKTGITLNCDIRAEVLESIFHPASPLHDGAVIISNGRISAAACFLPLSRESNIDAKFGTRHRAALGVSEISDAVAIVVSEERGEVNIATKGEITPEVSEQELKTHIAIALQREFRQ